MYAGTTGCAYLASYDMPGCLEQTALHMGPYIFVSGECPLSSLWSEKCIIE